MKSATAKWFSRTLLSGAVAVTLAVSGAESFASSAPTTGPAPAVQPAAKSDQAQPAGDHRAAVPTIGRNAVARYPGWENPALARIAVHNGRQALEGIRMAREAIEHGDVAKAREDLAAAAAFSDNIRFMSPYTVVVNRFNNARNETVGTTSDVVVDDMLPIYSGVESMSAFDVEQANKAKAPQQAARSSADQTSHAKSDKADQSDASGKVAASEEKVEEVGADVTASTLYLPVRYVSGHITIARRALARDKPDLDAAKTALTDALDSLVQTTVDMHLLPGQGNVAAKAGTSPGGTQQPSQAAQQNG